MEVSNTRWQHCLYDFSRHYERGRHWILPFAADFYKSRMVATLLSIFSQFCSEVMANRERTFIMVKPDGVQRGIVGEIIQRFEKRGYKLVAMKFMQVNSTWSPLIPLLSELKFTGN